MLLWPWPWPWPWPWHLQWRRLAHLRPRSSPFPAPFPPPLETRWRAVRLFARSANFVVGSPFPGVLRQAFYVFALTTALALARRRAPLLAWLKSFIIREPRPLRLLKRRLRRARSYAEWARAAVMLDELEGANAWKRDESDELSLRNNHALLKERTALYRDLVDIGRSGRVVGARAFAAGGGDTEGEGGTEDQGRAFEIGTPGRGDGAAAADEAPAASPAANAANAAAELIFRLRSELLRKHWGLSSSSAVPELAAAGRCRVGTK